MHAGSECPIILQRAAVARSGDRPMMISEEMKRPIGAVRAPLLSLLEWMKRAEADLSQALAKGSQARAWLDDLEKQLGAVTLDRLGWHQQEEGFYYRGPSWDRSIARVSRRLGTDMCVWGLGPKGAPVKSGRSKTCEDGMRAADDALLAQLSKTSPVVPMPPDLSGVEITAAGGTAPDCFARLSDGRLLEQIGETEFGLFDGDGEEIGRWSGTAATHVDLVVFALACGATETKRLLWDRAGSLLQLLDKDRTVHYRIMAQPGLDGSVEWWIWDRASRDGERRILDDLTTAILSTEETARAAGWIVGPRR